jgi:hypothetical protein
MGHEEGPAEGGNRQYGKKKLLRAHRPKKTNGGFARFCICQSPLSLRQIASGSHNSSGKAHSFEPGANFHKRASLSKISSRSRPMFGRRGGWQFVACAAIHWGAVEHPKAARCLGLKPASFFLERKIAAAEQQQPPRLIPIL